MERSCAAGGSSNGQPREESGDGSVQIQAFGKLIRSPGTCHPELGRSCAGKCQLRPISAQSYHLPSALTLRSSPQGSHLPRAAPRTGSERAAAPPPSVSPSHPPAGLRGRDGASPARRRERRRAAQRRGRRGRPAALRLSRHRSRHLWAPGITTPGFKPAGIRGARCGAGGTRAAPLANRRCLARPLA